MSQTETPTSDREVVLAIFHRHRAAPDKPFEESHFSDYLLAKPKTQGAVHNSFSGLRRYNAFIDEVQLHFSVCFSMQDFESTYSLERFVERVRELRVSKRASVTSLRNQQRRGFGWGPLFVGNLFLVVAFVSTLRYSSVLAASVAAFWVIVNAVGIRFYLRWRSYCSRLMSQLQSEGPHDL